MVKRTGYPEDLTQSAYSSQLIRIPLFAIIFYLSCFISREATTRQWCGGDRNQLLGGQTHTYTYINTRIHTLYSTLQFENDSVCIRYDDECVTVTSLSVNTNFQCCLPLCLSPPFVWAEWEQLLSGKAHKRTATQQPSCKANSVNCSEERAKDCVRPWGKKTENFKVLQYEIWNLSALCT